MVDDKPSTPPLPSIKPPATYRVPVSTPPPSPRRRALHPPLPPSSDDHPEVQAFRNKLQSISDHEGLAISFLDPELQELLETATPSPPKGDEKP